MMKREDPGAGAFLTISAGETVSSKFDLSSEYDTTKAAEYTVAVDLYLEYVEGSAGSLQETKLFYLSSPAVSFQVVWSNVRENEYIMRLLRSKAANSVFTWKWYVLINGQINVSVHFLLWQ